MEQPNRRVSPAETALSFFSLACWLVAVLFLVSDTASTAVPALQGLARVASPVVGFALPLAVGSQALLALRRPARSPGWRTFQWVMLGLSVLGFSLAAWKLVR
jgi:hypothetical protein